MVAKFHAWAAELRDRVEAVEHAEGGAGENSGAGGNGAPASPRGRAKRDAGLWKVLQAALQASEERVLDAVGQRGDATDAAVKRCIL
jgi:hypothetical protein